ncbi:MAG: hypothetical protein ACI97A_003728 [Planctomycetota bacterium]|jgi:hypothetical protein
MTESMQNRLAVGFICLLVASLVIYALTTDEQDPAAIDHEASQAIETLPSQARIPHRSLHETELTSSPANETEAIILSPIPPGEKLFVPDYGPFLRRGQGRAEFSFTDGRRRPLRSKTPPKFSLFRRHQDQWIKVVESTFFDENSAILKVDGPAHVGLEPGEYELDADCSPYGAKRISFRIGPGQTFVDTVQFSIWRHVLAIRFQDESGRLLDRINFAPTVSAKSQTLPKKSRSARPDKVLAKPPGAISVFTERGYSRNHHNSLTYGRGALLLDNGAWHLPVFIGAVNTIDIPFRKKDHGQRSFTMATTFKDKIQIPELFTVRLSPELSDKMRGMENRNETNVGNLNVTNSSPLAQTKERAPTLGDDLFTLRMGGFSPTMREYVLQYKLAWTFHDAWQGTHRGSRSPEELGRDVVSIEKLKADHLRRFDRFTVTLQGGEDHRDLGTKFNYDIHGKEKLNGGVFEIPFTGPSLAMRIVDPQGRPIPWAEASIVDLDQDKVAQGLRQQLVDVGTNLPKYKLKVVFTGKTENEPDREGFIAGYSFTPPDFIKGTKSRSRFRKFGSWHNSRRSLRGDMDGYMFLTKSRLKAGNAMVLYIWGQSRDQNSPDRRVVFRVTRGTTDLGAIVVNDHN